MSLIGFWLGLSTHAGSRESNVFLDYLRRYVKYGGWILGVGGLVILIRIVLTIAGFLPE